MYVNFLRTFYTNSTNSTENQVVTFITQCQYCRLVRFLISFGRFVQSITIQCLEALLHGLGLINCDLKPRNILVKSYSRCELVAAVSRQITYSPVQSRSYRAPEVIFGTGTLRWLCYLSSITIFLISFPQYINVFAFIFD